MIPLPIVPVASLTSRAQYFHCDHLHANLSARACVAHQTGGDPNRDFCRRLCLTGAEVRRRTEDPAQPDVFRRSRLTRIGTKHDASHAFVEPDPGATCTHPGCTRPPQRVKKRNGRPDLATLCQQHREAIINAETAARRPASRPKTPVAPRVRPPYWIVPAPDAVCATPGCGKPPGRTRARGTCIHLAALCNDCRRREYSREYEQRKLTKAVGA